MARAQNRHDTAKHKKKKHPASKCGKAKCMVCHSDKVGKVPDRQRMRADEQLTNKIINYEKDND